MQSLIRHLHAFVRDVRLTEPEWLAGIEFLTRTGQISDNKRQEMILLSDNLGVSALVNMVSAGVPEGATESTVLGPFYVPESPAREWGESVLLRDGDDVPLLIHGRVLGPQGEPVPGATIEIWQTDANGMYDIQDKAQPEHNLRGWYRARQNGEYLLKTIRPTSYPIPTDGPVGEMILQVRRHPMRPAHIHFLVNAKGYEPLITHVFIDGDKYLDSDVVFGVKDELIAKVEKRTDATTPDGKPVKAPWHLMTYEFHLKPGAGEAPQPMGVKTTEPA
jgi:catechol 1,2-dioxygenase